MILEVLLYRLALVEEDAFLGEIKKLFCLGMSFTCRIYVDLNSYWAPGIVKQPFGVRGDTERSEVCGAKTNGFLFNFNLVISASVAAYLSFCPYLRRGGIKNCSSKLSVV